jgi:hypothetical protein
LREKNQPDLAVEFFGKLAEESNVFWRKNWLSDLWHSLPGGFVDARDRCPIRMCSNSTEDLFSNIGIEKILTNEEITEIFSKYLPKIPE